MQSARSPKLNSFELGICRNSVYTQYSISSDYAAVKISIVAYNRYQAKSWSCLHLLTHFASKITVT